MATGPQAPNTPIDSGVSVAREATSSVNASLLAC